MNIFFRSEESPRDLDQSYNSDEDKKEVIVELGLAQKMKNLLKGLPQMLLPSENNQNKLSMLAKNVLDPPSLFVNYFIRSIVPYTNEMRITMKNSKTEMSPKRNKIKSVPPSVKQKIKALNRSFDQIILDKEKIKQPIRRRRQSCSCTECGRYNQKIQSLTLKGSNRVQQTLFGGKKKYTNFKREVLQFQVQSEIFLISIKKQLQKIIQRPSYIKTKTKNRKRQSQSTEKLSQQSQLQGRSNSSGKIIQDLVKNLEDLKLSSDLQAKIKSLKKTNTKQIKWKSLRASVLASSSITRIRNMLQSSAKKKLASLKSVESATPMNDNFCDIALDSLCQVQKLNNWKRQTIETWSSLKNPQKITYYPFVRRILTPNYDFETSQAHLQKAWTQTTRYLNTNIENQRTSAKDFMKTKNKKVDEMKFSLIEPNSSDPNIGFVPPPVKGIWTLQQSKTIGSIRKVVTQESQRKIYSEEEKNVQRLQTQRPATQQMSVKSAFDNIFTNHNSEQRPLTSQQSLYEFSRKMLRKPKIRSPSSQVRVLTQIDLADKFEQNDPYNRIDGIKRLNLLIRQQKSQKQGSQEHRKHKRAKIQTNSSDFLQKS